MKLKPKSKEAILIGIQNKKVEIEKLVTQMKEGFSEIGNQLRKDYTET